MENMTFDMLDTICEKIVQQKSLFHGLICTCTFLHNFGKYRKQNNENKCMMDTLKYDNIEQAAIIIHKHKNADDVFKLALIHGSNNIAWWTWSQHRPFMTIQILMDVQKQMFISDSFNCNEFTYRVLKCIQCAHEAARKRSLFI